jgi:hypothetical protein
MLIDTHIVHEQDRQAAIEFRAALIQQVKALEQQRAALLAQVAILERKYKIGKEMNNGNGSKP